MQQCPLLPLVDSNSQQAIMAPQDTIVWNSDAAWSRDSNTTWLGWISSSGVTHPISGTKSYLNVASPLLAEALALREDVAAAISLSANNVWFKSDLQELVKALHSRLYPMELYGVLMDVECLSRSFDFISFSSVPRDQNSVADRLAKSAIRPSA